MSHKVSIPFTHKGKELKKGDSVTLSGKAKQLYENLGYVKPEAAKVEETKAPVKRR